MTEPSKAPVVRIPAGTCPGCRRASHPGLTCNGRTTDQVVRILKRWPGTVYVPIRDDPR